MALLAGVKTALLVGIVLLSLLWWRSEADRCVCEHCPDGYCTFGDQIHAALTGSEPDSLARVLDQGRHYLHAHSPLAPVLLALTMLAGAAPVLSFMLLSIAATALCWISLRRTIQGTWPIDATILLLLFVAFWSNAVVIRSVARPVTDAVGMLCVVWSLAACITNVRERSRASAVRLILLQILGLSSRVSFIPMLAIPALAELVEAAPWRERLVAAVRAAALFGLLPAVLFFGAARALGFEHLQEAWTWAHRPDFVSADPVRDFARSFVLAGGVYLLLALWPSRGARTRTERIHLAWIVLYLTFLATGRGALWPRYFLPVVPSFVVIGTPALVRLRDRRPALAWGLVVLVALWGLRSIAPSVNHPAASLAMLAGSLHASEASHEGRKLAPSAEGAVSVSSNRAAARAARMLDGSVDTAWATSAPQKAGTAITIDLGRPRRVGSILLSPDPVAPSRGLTVDGSLDEQTWAPLDATLEMVGFFAERPSVVLRLRPEKVRWLRLTATTQEAEAWVIFELEVHAPRRVPGKRRRSAPAAATRTHAPLEIALSQRARPG